MSWGIKIAILYIGFIGMILFFVIRAMSENVDLVTEDYYQKELQFEQQITKDNAARKLGASPTVNISADNVEIVFPDTLMQNPINGQVTFYRPSDSSKDFVVKLNPDTNGKQIISRSQFITGLYQVKINWNSSATDYYHEVALYIP